MEYRVSFINVQGYTSLTDFRLGDPETDARAAFAGAVGSPGVLFAVLLKLSEGDWRVVETYSAPQ